MNPRRVDLSGERVVDADPAAVFDMLIEPERQLQWNSLYLSASRSPVGPIADGSVMTGRFKGAGRATVTFADVLPGRSFTHLSRLLIAGRIPLGSFSHRYEVTPAGSGTLVRQTVAVELNWLGRVLRRPIAAGFEKRLPESFDELARHATSPHRVE